HQISNNLFGYGLGINYHIYNSPLAIERPIFFVGLTGGAGSASDTTSINGEIATGPKANFEGGSMSFLSLGGGFKYFIEQGVGMKFIVDYYQRYETYNV